MDYSIDALASQFRGRSFRELVLEHAKQPVEQLTAALEGTLEQLPPLLLDEAPKFFGKASSLADKPNFWTEDAGRVLIFLTTRMRDELHALGARTDDNVLLTLFNAIVLNFARNAGAYPSLQPNVHDASPPMPRKKMTQEDAADAVRAYGAVRVAVSGIASATGWREEELITMAERHGVRVYLENGEHFVFAPKLAEALHMDGVPPPMIHGPTKRTPEENARIAAQYREMFLGPEERQGHLKGMGWFKNTLLLCALTALVQCGRAASRPGGNIANAAVEGVLSFLLLALLVGGMAYVLGRLVGGWNK